MKAKFAGNYYWYYNNFITDTKEAFNKNQSLVIDSIQPIKNWLRFKKEFPKIPLISVFLFTDDVNLLKSRIMTRANCSPEDISLRLKHAQEVLSEASLYDFKIDTTDFSLAKEKISAIIKDVI